MLVVEQLGTLSNTQAIMHIKSLQDTSQMHRSEQQLQKQIEKLPTRDTPPKHPVRTHFERLRKVQQVTTNKGHQVTEDTLLHLVLILDDSSIVKYDPQIPSNEQFGILSLQCECGALMPESKGDAAVQKFMTPGEYHL